ncbi:MAG TPA: alpha-L-fucosidase [Thermomicrobiales bacterium]|nr:alpha-L-fucosidase [Thermomicrobiales bacterium]
MNQRDVELTARNLRRQVSNRNAAGPFAPDWDSLRANQVPAWYQDGKFGIFVHWGVYAVPAFGNEWYPRNMYIPGSREFEHHRATYGDQTEFGYADFIDQFTAERFDPGVWAEIFRKAGAQFVVPTAEHHDGFPLYDSQLTRWNAVQLGPRRDLIGELGEAVRRAGMVFGVSSHRAEHWWFMNGGRTFPSDVQDPARVDFYGPAQSDQLQPNDQYLEDWLARCCEIVDRYEPQLFWFDWWIEQPAFEPYLREFASYYYNRAADWRREVAINFKHQAFPQGVGVYDVERGQLAGIRNDFWQTDTAVARNSWGYTHNNDYKQPADLIGDLVDIVSKNGALLLNIGPRADGTIPQEDIAVLSSIGDWLRICGEAVYGTRPWLVFGEGPTDVIEGSFQDTARSSFTAADIRFTQRTSISEGKSRMLLYATALAIPEDRRMAITTLGTSFPLGHQSIKGISLVTGGWRTEPSLEYEVTEAALLVRLPDSLAAEHAVSIRIELD